jgi:hypothetical protein
MLASGAVPAAAASSSAARSSASSASSNRRASSRSESCHKEAHLPGTRYAGVRRAVDLLRLGVLVKRESRSSGMMFIVEGR